MGKIALPIFEIFPLPHARERTFDFATIGFRPFAEPEEFVTTGAVALDADARPDTGNKVTCRR